MRASKSFVTPIDLPEETRQQVIDLLNQSLADLFDLHSQVKFAHWNVKGSHFIGLHKLFDEFADDLQDPIDEVAERATALGGLARGTARMACETSRLPEFPEDTHAGLEVVSTLLDRYGTAGNHIREAAEQADSAKDIGTADLLTGISRLLDKHIYFLEAHLQ